MKTFQLGACSAENVTGVDRSGSGDTAAVVQGTP